jgi:hypothetical protein
MWDSLEALLRQLRRHGPDPDWNDVFGIFHRWVTAESAVLGKVLAEDAEQNLPDGGPKVWETPTHYKWCLVDLPQDSFTLWIHEYKAEDPQVRLYARSIHNHRYDFCTTILSGSYLHERFGVDVTSAGDVRAVTALAAETVKTGDSLVLQADEYHRVTGFDDATLTLVVKSRPRTAWSYSVDEDAKRLRRHVSAADRVDFLVAKLRGTQPS